MPRLRVVAVPAFVNRSVNPYNALLYGAVRRVGATVVEAAPWRLLGRRPDVLHVHWPDYFFSAPGMLKAIAKSLLLMGVVGVARTRQARVVWTIHNVRPHEEWHARWEARMWRWFVARVDGYIALTAAGQAAALARFPALGGRPGFVIPHGHYRDEYPDEVDRAAARAALDLPPDARVVTFLGAIRPYKNLPALIDAFRGVPGAEWRLLVAGKPASDELEGAIRRRAAGDPRIRLDLAFVPKERVQHYLRAADLVVFPYREILNSGSALLALSFERPILVPERGAMAELRDAVGGEWVRTYAGEPTAATLVGAMAWVRATPRDPARLLRDLDWEEIARQTLEAYEAVRRVAATRPRQTKPTPLIYAPQRRTEFNR